MELIAGIEQSTVSVKEENCRFLLDVRTVYYCSRLHTERARVLAASDRHGVLFDAFCGVGPFALQFAKAKDSVVLANDLNPECLHYFRLNQKSNKVEARSLGFHSDARCFLQMMLRLASQLILIHLSHCSTTEALFLLEKTIFEYNLSNNLSGQCSFIENWRSMAHQLLRVSAFGRYFVYMNLPGENIDFLDALDFDAVAEVLGQIGQFQLRLDFFVTCFEDVGGSAESVSKQAQKRVIEKVSAQNMKSKVAWRVDFAESREIKNVSSSKTMLCVHFQLKLAQKEAPVPQVLGAHSLEQSTGLLGTKKVKSN